MNEEVTRRRTPSPGLVAIRSERLALAAVRRQMGDLQKRAAFIQARSTSTHGHDPEATTAQLAELRQQIAEALADVETVMDGKTGVGPAEDCRKALRQLSDRLPGL